MLSSFLRHYVLKLSVSEDPLSGNFIITNLDFCLFWIFSCRDFYILDYFILDFLVLDFFVLDFYVVPKILMLITEGCRFESLVSRV